MCIKRLLRTRLHLIKEWIRWTTLFQVFNEGVGKMDKILALKLMFSVGFYENWIRIWI